MLERVSVMNFTYETQGAITYLVCELAATEQVDSLTLGMLTNNHIPGLAPVLYTEMNGQRYLKYNISAKISADQFFSGNMNKQRILTAFSNILNAICSADEYMIDQNSFSVESKHIFLNVSSCESALICVPVTIEKDINAEVAVFFKQVLFTTQIDSSENISFVTEMITYLNNSATFNVYGFRDLVAKLQSTNGTAQAPIQNNMYASQGASVMSTPVTPTPVAPTPVAPTPVAPTPAAPASSFNATITIDDMPGLMAQQTQPPVQPQVPPVQKPVVPQPQVIPQSPVIPQKQMAPQKPVDKAQQTKQPVISGGRPITGGTPSVAIPKPPVSNGAGFAIPGQQSNVAKPVVAPVSKANTASKPDNGEKKLSFLGLLTNYSKENAALYKAQKDEAKKSKTTQGKTVGKDVTDNKRIQSPAGNQPLIGGPARQQPIVQQQYHPPIQPVPVQNSFNETTVLSSFSGETTVLSANPVSVEPYLTRVKTGERISLNKPVFRIGKEKSYVDYFIADNTAISRSHCNIHTENGEYFIEDTNSTNHTYINGKIINSNIKTKLTNGDKVRLANEDFIFSL